MIRHTFAALLIALPGVLILEAGTSATTRTLPACQAEDGSGQRVCVWDARHMGNGGAGGRSSSATEEPTG